MHHIECDLCGSDITLTIMANSRSFYRHRHSEACIGILRNKGLLDYEHIVPLIPRIFVERPTDQSLQVGVPSPGLAITWEPASIWETYPYHQHEDQLHLAMREIS